jgi:hypothetical protein
MGLTLGADDLCVPSAVLDDMLTRGVLKLRYRNARPYAIHKQQDLIVLVVEGDTEPTVWHRSFWRLAQ